MVETSPLRSRTKEFAVRVLKLVAALPAKRAADVVGKQLLRSATSVGANYRAACRARSVAEFCSKMGIVEEEGDESAYWLEILIAGELVSEHLLRDLLREANEIVAMTVASIRTAKKKRDAD